MGARMVLILLTLMLLASCSSGPVEFRRGSPVAPAPANVRPGVGAPVLGQPSQPHGLPRSPYGRVLPQTPETRKEPGIWAGDDPRRAPHPPAFVDDVQLPNLEPATSKDETVMAYGCANMMPHTMRRLGVYPMQGLTYEQRRCVVAEYFDDCVKSVFKQVPYLFRHEGLDKRWRELTAEFRRKACASVKPSKDLDAILNAHPRDWNMRTMNPNTGDGP